MKIWSIYTKGYYSTIKKKEKNVGKWINLENTLTEGTRARKTKVTFFLSVDLSS